jgi:hypothetical protein
LSLTLRERIQDILEQRIFGLKMDGKIEDLKFLSEDLRDIYCSPGIIRIMKSRSSSWAGHVARLMHIRNAYTI